MRCERRTAAEANGTFGFDALKHFSPGRRYSLNIVKAKQLTRELEEELMSLLEANMRTLYEHSEQGWVKRDKLRELRESPSRILTLRRYNGADEKDDGAPSRESGSKHRGDDSRNAAELAGYCLFRLDTEECDEKEPLKERGETDLEIVYWCVLQGSCAHAPLS